MSTFETGDHAAGAVTGARLTALLGALALSLSTGAAAAQARGATEESTAEGGAETRHGEASSGEPAPAGATREGQAGAATEEGAPPTAEEARETGAEEPTEGARTRAGAEDEQTAAAVTVTPPPAQPPAAQPPTAQPPAAQPPTAQPQGAQPPTTCAASARGAAVDAVVRVRSGNEWGAGFVYGEPNTVVTSFRVVSLGRPVTLVTRDGTHLPAHVVARDESYDVAILRTDEPVPGATPLEPAPETSAMLGRPVVALGHPFPRASRALGARGDGLLRWSISEGIIAAVNDEGVQADMALSDGFAGAPLLDCSGRVLGMVAGAGILSEDVGLAVRIGHVASLVEEAPPSGDFIGNTRFRFGLGGLLLIDQDGRTAAGGYVTVGATFFDRLSWMNRVGLLMGGAPRDPTDISINTQRIRWESMVGWRFFVDVGGFANFYIVPALGVTVNHISTTHHTFTSMASATCTPTSTIPCVVNNKTEGWQVNPAAGLSFLFGWLSVGYTFELVVATPTVTTMHALRVGALF